MTLDDSPHGMGHVYGEIHRERARAQDLHGIHSMEAQAWDSATCLPILLEEVGEAARVLNDLGRGDYTDDHIRQRLRAELVQVAAMATTWAELCDPMPPRVPTAVTITADDVDADLNVVEPYASWSCPLCDHQGPSLLRSVARIRLRVHNDVHHRGQNVATIDKEL